MNDEIRISFINKGVRVERNDAGELELVPNLPCNGDRCEVVDLKELWFSQEKMDKSAPKGTNGMIFPLDLTRLYSIDYIRDENLTGNGIIFLDIDCGKDLVQTIYDAIPKINEIMCGNILAAAKTAKGVHVLCLSNRMTVDEYTAKNFYLLAAFAVAVQRVTSIDLREVVNIDPLTGQVHKCLDTCTFSMKQRLWLRYCDKVYWNDECNKVSLSQSDQAKLREMYPDLYKAMMRRLGYYDSHNNSNKVSRVTKFNVDVENQVGKHPYIEHQVRWRLFRSLCCCFRSDEAELWRQWERCCNMMAEGNGHNLRFYLSEPHRNRWLERWDDNENKTADQNLLEEFGYTVKGKKTVHIIHF